MAVSDSGVSWTEAPITMRTLLSTALLASVLASTSVLAAEKPNGPVKTEQAAKDISSGIQILDVRTEEEWNEGHIQGAKRVQFPAEDFVEKATKALDPEKPVLVYCRSGGRSAKAAKQLRDAGFKDVRDLAGGVVAWEKDGQPLVKPDAQKAK